MPATRYRAMNARRVCLRLPNARLFPFAYHPAAADMGASTEADASLPLRITRNQEILPKSLEVNRRMHGVVLVR